MAGFKEYQMMFQLNASVGGGFQSAFTTGASSVSQLQEKINALNRTQSDIASYQKQQSAIDKTKAKIDLYTTQLNNLKSATASTSKEEAELANAIAAKEKQLNDSTTKLAEQNAALSETGNALRQAGVDTNNLANESQRLKAEAQEVANAQRQEAEAAQQAGQSLQDAMSGAAAALEAAGVITALKAVYSALEDCSTVAAEFETAMAGVKRTVGGNDSFISGLGESFKELSTQIPISATELASIATTAGQLGIAQDNVQTFTTVMAQLATTTDLSADNAATMLAQFANITGVTDYERLGSAVAALGDSTATTASKVVDMSQGMAAAASLAGMSSTDILAISAAVGSLGIEAASGSTSMSQLITKLYKATETGDQLEEIAAVAGMTAAEFKQAWGQDAVSAMDAFIQGLNNVEQNGASAVVVLDNLGINNVRQTKAILGLASAGNLLSNTISVANSAWAENSALTQKAGVMYNTTEAKLTMMGNAANNVKIAVGDALNPAISAVSDAITGLLQPLSEWIADNPALVQGITVAIGVIGVATGGVLAFKAAALLAAKASALLAASIPGLNIILGVAAGLGVLTAAISAIVSANSEASKSFDEMNTEYDNLIDQFEEQSAVLDLVDEYKDLSTQTNNLQTLMSKGFNATVSVKADSTKISPEDFLSSTEVKLTAYQVSELLAAGFMNPNDDGITISASQTAELLAQGFLKPGDKGITLKASQVADLVEKGFLKPDDKGITITARQAQTLQEKGFLDPKSGGIELTATQKATLKQVDFMAPNDEAITLTAQQTANLYKKGFFAADDEAITLDAQQTADLYAKGFLAADDQGITLSAKQTAELLAEGFLDPETGSVVKLDATAVASIKSSEFMEEQVVTLTAKADPDKKLTAADFGISDQTLLYIATMDETSRADVEAKAKALQSELVSVNSQLNSAKIDLASSQQLAQALSDTIAGEPDQAKKSAMETQLEQLNEKISEQKTEVAELQSKHDQLSGEYSIVSTAADELKGKEEQLLAVKQQLAGVTSDVSAASENQASAYDAEAEAAERDAKAQLAILQNQIYGSISEQAKSYKRTVNEASEATESYNNVVAMQAVANKLSGQTADQVEESYRNMLHTLDDMEAAEGWSPNNEDYKQAVAEAEAFMSLLTGMDYSGLQADADRLSDGTIQWADSFEYLADHAQNWNDRLMDMNEGIVQYKSEIDSAEGTHNEFIDNLVQGITSGAVTYEEVEARVTDALKGEADAEETVAAIMADVQAGIDAASQAKEDYTAASEELTEEEHRSVDEIVADLKTLQSAYNEAYDSAYSSMSGQFKLFEDASEKIESMRKGIEGGTQGMTNSLNSQQAYIEEYTNNFTRAQKKLAEAGVSAETAQTILAALSDGSEESGAALQSIAEGSNDDVKSLAASYEGLEEAKSKYASIVAETETDFSTKMANLASELEATIASMDKSSEAAANAKTTLEAYVNAADGYVSIASTKYGAVAAAAVAALKSTFSGLGIPGFAKGTTNAGKGMAIVGEEGPELVYFNGGETVVPADKTAQMAKAIDAEAAEPSNSNITNNGSSYNLQFSPSFQVESGVNSDTLKSVLEEQSVNLREQLEDLLDEITEDENRRNLR